jgi:hypothetical protein
LQDTQFYEDYEDFKVFGCQWRFQERIEWHVGLWSKSRPTFWCFRIADGVPEQRLSGKRLEAVQAAIREWEARPALA